MSEKIGFPTGIRHSVTEEANILTPFCRSEIGRTVWGWYFEDDTGKRHEFIVKTQEKSHEL